MKSEFIKSTKGNLLDGPAILIPEKYEDNRGFFLESWNSKNLNQLLGKEINFVQDNHSYSKKDVEKNSLLDFD